MDLKEAQARIDAAEDALARENDYQQQITDLLFCLRGEQSIDESLKNINQFFLRHLPLLFNVCYFISDDTIDIIGSFALDNGQLTKREQQISEQGFIADMITQQQIVRFSELNENSFKVHTFFGDIIPQDLLFLPMIYQGKTVGLFEMGFVNRLNDNDYRFIIEANDILSSQLSAAYSRLRLQLLLETVQNQEEELRQQTEELRVTNEELNSKLAMIDEQNREIAAQKTELEQQVQEVQLANRYKSEFLANMSHELRTPLNSLLLLANGLLKNRQKNLNAEQLEDLAIIKTSGNNLLELINDILDLAKVEAGKLTVKFTQVTLSEIIGKIDKQFRPIAKDKQLKFEICNQCSSLSQTLQTDPLRLEQILANLLSNAFKFTKQGQVSLTISQSHQTMSFTVQDSGIGIASDQQTLIFDAFKQVDGSSSRQRGGTGLGLNIARNLASLLHGELRLEQSTIEQGSMFTLELPIHTASSDDTNVDDKPKLESPAVTNSQNETVLIIEDDIVFANYLKNMAASMGKQGVIALSGQQAIELARALQPCGIILDLVLPDADGELILKQLKSHTLTKDIPVHIISTKDANDELLKQGALCVLTKPVNDDALTAIFDSYRQSVNSGLRQVLVIDDDEATQHALKKLLTATGAHVDVVGTGAEAISCYQRQRYDCLIVDYCLSDMTGLEILKQITTETQAGNLPMTIVYTGRELSTETYRELNAYTQHFVNKGPQTSQRLLDEMTLFLHTITASLQNEAKSIVGRLDHLSTSKKAITILLVDDDLRNCFALSSQLQHEGYDAVIADSATLALQKLSELGDGIDIVLMDMMMPDIDGYETIRQIRQQSAWHDLPIIALTAKAMPQDRQKCLDAGADDYLSKPIDFEKLLGLIQVWVNQA